MAFNIPINRLMIPVKRSPMRKNKLRFRKKNCTSWKKKDNKRIVYCVLFLKMSVWLIFKASLKETRS